ncbi:hypothetical protein NECAME_12308 [Necator americanus]|uniref:Uncharacterized protein n=1 Tax=Necator americanus TaxID=51031 RepID=W2T3M1_NECAM|nr:hypothetical protein NECAME_12308 [Necator americanus]ETN75577.1 hypothetical protein NECAME_12308 [Necator americanus]
MRMNSYTSHRLKNGKHRRMEGSSESESDQNELAKIRGESILGAMFPPSFAVILKAGMFSCKENRC